MSPTAKRLVADIRESAAQIARNPKWPASQGPKHLGSRYDTGINRRHFGYFRWISDALPQREGKAAGEG
jgi:hypothetical protein